MKVHLLTPGFTSPNGCAFLFPLLVWRREIEASGIDITFFDSDLNPHLTDADLLMVDSKYHRSQWARESDMLLDRFACFNEVIPVAFFDTGDSSGGLLVDLLKIVTKYYKSQLIEDKSVYLKPHYGRRIYTNFYHERHHVVDEHPDRGKAVTDSALLSKLGVSWNSGMSDYSFLGPIRLAAYRKFGLKAMLRFSKPERIFRSVKSKSVSCRFGTSYARDSVSYQRRAIRDLLRNKLPVDKLNRWSYMKELYLSKVVVSPFGLGEITLKDFETFLAGGLLLKPDMSHLITWPNFFRTDKTIKTHSWGLDDFLDALEDCITNFSQYQDIAREGQKAYLRYTSSSAAPALFIAHLTGLLRNTLKQN